MTAKRLSGLRLVRSIRFCNRSNKRMRLGSPVSASWSVSCARRSSTNLRGVISDCDPTIRYGVPFASLTEAPRLRTQRNSPLLCLIRYSSSKCSAVPFRCASNFFWNDSLSSGWTRSNHSCGSALMSFSCSPSISFQRGE